MELSLIFGIVILIFSIIIHEVAHGAVANMLGDPTARLAGRLTLNPISHIDLVGSIIFPLISVLLPGGFVFGWAKPVPYNPYNLRGGKWGEGAVAFAGVGVNFLLALIFGLLIRFGAPVLSPSFIEIAAIIVFYNLMLMVINLIPIPPLDGSKVLAAVLPYHASRAVIDFGERIATFGLLGLLLIFFLFGSVFTAIIRFIFSLITGLHA